ncbi:MAG: hypothetical protein JO143_07915 [Acetobacteraceae bacterium]|nr:hypothetical protein [Acetobacteraceae bacterium]
MESLASYLRRKRHELWLIEACLAGPASAEQARSLEEVAEQKFRAGAAVKAEQARSTWALTETHWAEGTSLKVGQFEVAYTYQRADLAVHGPPLYDGASQRVVWSGYTSSGMAALATVLMALGRTLGGAVVMMRPDGYPETRQLIETYGPRIGVAASFETRPPQADPRALRVLLLDSGVPARFSVPDPASAAAADLLVFDTTCLATSSGRLARVLRRADEAGLPSVLVRSHTKLDSLGIEYGRLGSVVLLVPPRVTPERRRYAERLAQEVADAVRLFGAAAVPAHLPPFVGGAHWRRLCRQRVARIIRNNRRAARRLSALLPGPWAARCYQHGLFLTLDPGTEQNENEARSVASALAHALHEAGLPVRQAGSFGFDFAVIDAFPAVGSERFILRLAVADLPGAVVDAIATEAAAWAGSGQAGRRSAGCARDTGPR